MDKPNILYIMCDQLRYDAIAALGNNIVRTPNIDRLVKRGASFTNAYSTCPVCVPARYTIRTGCEPFNTGIYSNGPANLVEGQPEEMEERCGPYLARSLRNLGYRTFGIGKFHTFPMWDEDIGFDVHMHSEELFDSEDQRRRDSYASFIANDHPEYDFIEQLHGERTEMYYMPQMSPLPAELTVEAWAADRAVEQIETEDSKPYFGFVSMIGPHPPCSPPIPYNRMYNPDCIPDPVVGDIVIDHMDEQIPFMNYLIWAEDINNSHARVLKARYYGEISYIDACIGRILDAVEKRADADNTIICFFSDHGDHLGDHHAWQKESFFDVSCKIPFLVSWPSRISADMRRDELVCLTDLFGIATSAAGCKDVRDGVDVLGLLNGTAKARDYLYGYYGVPGTPAFKIMVRDSEWKYIFLANGGREQLFNLVNDPYELKQEIGNYPEVVERMRKAAIQGMRHISSSRGLEGDMLKKFDYKALPKFRIRQFDSSRGVSDFQITVNS